MGTVLSEVTTWFTGDAPADFATNTVYHTIGGEVFDPTVDYASHATEVLEAFAGTDPTYHFPYYTGRNVRVRCYDLGDPLPRPVRATASSASSVDLPAAAGPRQVALVLSFYGTRNLVHHRGHIYVGPWTLEHISGPEPDSTTLSNMLKLGHALFDVGGEDVAHVVRSRTEEANTVVANYWADNRWDTQRRRLPKATSRVTLAP